MYKILRPQKKHYTSAMSFRYAVECDEIEGIIYQVPVPIYEWCSTLIYSLRLLDVNTVVVRWLWFGKILILSPSFNLKINETG